MSQLNITEVNPHGSLPDGRYHTCPKYGPQVMMANREVEINNRVVTMIHDPFYSFSFYAWFEVNNLVTLEPI